MIKLKSKFRLLVIIPLVIILSTNITQITAYNHEPGVEVGDDFVYYVYDDDIYMGATKYEVTEIYDEGGKTKIKTYVSIGQGYEGYFTTQGPDDFVLGVLTDYSVNPEYIFDWFLVTNGTQIADYIDEFITNEIHGPGAVYESIYAGYGINCTKADGSTYIRRFSTFGVMSYEETNTSSGIRIVELFAVNGNKYHQAGITTPILISGFIATMFVIVLLRRKKTKHSRKI